jgi:hypothetical protein
MTRRDQTRRKSGRAVFAFLRRPVATWFAMLALLVQMIGFGAAPTAASAEQRAAAALSVAIGQQVSLCAQGEHSGAPDQSCPCCDDCAFCGLACGAPAPFARVFALLAPERVNPALHHPDDEAPARPPILSFAARPRAPPVPA